MKTSPTNPYILFNREEWSSLRDAEPLTLSEKEFAELQGIDEDLSIDEVSEIYLPLSRLLNYYVKASISRQHALAQFLDTKVEKIPFIIGIAGSVSVGKSTTARILKTLLSRWEEHTKVALVTTDGFLFPNEKLQEFGIMNRKGFPESYDIEKLLKFVSELKSGKRKVSAPVYSHLIYNIEKDKQNVVEDADVLILEGLNVLQSSLDYPKRKKSNVFVSDYLDFSIYVDADEALLEHWYINRFMKLRKGAFTDPNSYFKHYTKLTDSEAVKKAHSIWVEINKKNLIENILPTRERASLILTKGVNHAIDYIRLRK